MKEIQRNLLEYLKEDVQTPYDSVAVFYDWLHRRDSLLARFYYEAIWGFTIDEYLSNLKDWLPQNKNQIILDIPVGTGILVAEAYAKMTDTTFMAADCSKKMLLHAEKNFRVHEVKDVTYIRAHSSDLPFDDSSIDCILCMSGVDVFGDREGTMEEFYRVLRPGGSLIISLYTKGERIITDLWVMLFAAPFNFMHSPFYTKEEVPALLAGKYVGRIKLEASVQLKSKLYFKFLKL